MTTVGRPPMDAAWRAREEKASEELMAMSNWGRWGKDDERGAVNYVDLAAIRRGFASVKRGAVYRLCQDIREHGIPHLEGRPTPRLFMAFDGGDWAAGAGSLRTASGRGGLFSLPGGHIGVPSDEAMLLNFHASTTHIDSLAHYWVDDQMYNGFSGDLVTSEGAQKLGMEKMVGLVTHGIMLDVARLRGRDVMEGDDYVTEADVIQCCESQGVTIERGDVVLVHTGHNRVWEQDPESYLSRQPGVGASAALYMARREICLIGADNTGVSPSTPSARYGGVAHDPREGLGELHTTYLRNLGIYLLEMMDLTALARDQVYEFLFCLAPLMIVGSSGSPVNPLAVA